MPQPPMEPTDEMKEKAVQEAEERLKAQKELEAAEQKKARKAIKPGQKRPAAHMAEGMTSAQLSQLTPHYVDIGPKPFGIGPKRWKWSWKKHKERKKLRKDLKTNYKIKKWRDFEEIARQLGLGIDNPLLLGLLRFFHFLLGTGGILSILGAGTLALLGLFMLSFIQEQVGAITIQLNPKTIQDGFVLSNTADFEYKTARLKSEELMRVNAISMDDIVADVDVEKDGPHNGKFYIAYTYYIKNEGETAGGYEYSLVLQDSTRGLEKAVWIMLYEDGHQIIYATPNTRGADGEGEDGSPAGEPTERNPERLAGYWRPPFFDTAYSPTDQYYFYCRDGNQYITDSEGTKIKFNMDAEGNINIIEGNVPDSNRDSMIKSAENKWLKEWGVCATPTIDDKTVAYGIVENVQPGEIHKYTVVIWVEGDDVECTDDLVDAIAKYYIEFDPIDDGKRSLFNAIYRKEYDVAKQIEKRKQEEPTDEPEEPSGDETTD